MVDIRDEQSGCRFADTADSALQTVQMVSGVEKCRLGLSILAAWQLLALVDGSPRRYMISGAEWIASGLSIRAADGRYRMDSVGGSSRPDAGP